MAGAVQRTIIMAVGADCTAWQKGLIGLWRDGQASSGCSSMAGAYDGAKR